MPNQEWFWWYVRPVGFLLVCLYVCLYRNSPFLIHTLLATADIFVMSISFDIYSFEGRGWEADEMGFKLNWNGLVSFLSLTGFNFLVMYRNTLTFALKHVLNSDQICALVTYFLSHLK